MKSGNSFEHCKTHHFDYLNAQNKNWNRAGVEKKADNLQNSAWICK